ncbi:MAG: hypothetical protein OXR82_18385 [Gammaproteobacteria bacterium]|nr:hypothetical protein [Gammaproteobacteria bacterium]MDE0260341.1 hypothetical protein [Gammaproteobacteria bacterium]
MSESNMSPPGDERVRHLMMAEVDEEISGEERRELELALEENPDLREELETFHRLKEVTDTMTPLKPPEETWDTYWEDVYRRLERGIGWVLVSLGTIAAGTWALWNAVSELIRDTTMPGYVRWGLLALIAGFVILFVSVVRERLFTRKDDPYKDVVR